MIEPAGTKSADARGAQIWRGATRFLLPLALAALLGALAPARLAGASLGRQAITVGSAAGTYSVVVTTTGAWIATANDSFLHTTASGTGNGLAVFTVDAFTGTGTRIGTLTIAGLNMAVTQVGTNYAAVGPVTTPVSSGLQLPEGVAVDGSGNVYIADTGHNAIKEWNAATQQVTTPVSSGLALPWGVAVDGSGNVYIADDGDGAIIERDAATQTVTTLVSSGLSGPHGTAVDSSGNVYIADAGHNAIKEWNAATQQVTTLVSSGLAAPWGVAVDGSGNVYIADGNPGAIKEWNAATQQVTTLVSSAMHNSTGVAVDASGNVYGTFTYGSDPGSLEKINNAFETLGTTSLLVASAAGSGSVEVSFLPVDSTAPWSASTTDTWLHITNPSGAGGALLQFTYDANTTTTVRTGTITLDSGLTLTVTQVGTDYEQVTAPTTLVSSGLHSPHGVAVDDFGNVYIADTFNEAVKEWNASTQTVSTLVSSGLLNPSGEAVEGSGNV